MDVLLCPHLVFRYEPDVDGGTLFIFNKETGRIFVGNAVVYKVILYIKSYKDKRLTIQYLQNFILNSLNADPKKLIDILLKEKIICQV